MLDFIGLVVFPLWGLYMFYGVCSDDWEKGALTFGYCLFIVLGSWTLMFLGKI